MTELREMLDVEASRGWQSSDLIWAERLQRAMLQRGLSEAGRLIAPVLRPCFISRAQADGLAEACTRVSGLVKKLEPIVRSSRELMQRLRMLPAEKVLASQQCNGPGSGFLCSMEAAIHNGTVRIASIETGSPFGLGYAGELAELFDRSPSVSKIRQAGYSVEPFCGVSKLLPAIRNLWYEKTGTAKPALAVVASQSGAEGRFLARILSENGAPAKLCAPEHISCDKRSLCAGTSPVDLFYRRLSARDLLVQSGMTHPLLRAYREGTTCVVNGFASEAIRCRALFELLTDSASPVPLCQQERISIAPFIPWTRTLSRRKTTYGDQEVDLLAFAASHRETLTLRSMEDGCQEPTYNGAQCSGASWRRALGAAQPGGWIVQEHAPRMETFPTMQYGEIQVRRVQVSIHAHVIEGQLCGAIAQLNVCANGVVRPFALTPVFVVK